MGRYGYNIAQGPVITPEYEEDEFIIYPVLVLTVTGMSSHMRLSDNETHTVCGRQVNNGRTFTFYKEGDMFLLEICGHCKRIVRNEKRAGNI